MSSEAMRSTCWPKARMGRPAVFLDRDGVLNEPVPRSPGAVAESPLRPDLVRLAVGVVEGAFALREAGFALVAVSNQPGAAKGECSLDSLHAVHETVVQLLKAEGLELDGWYYCHHHPEAEHTELRVCACRKPEPGLLLTAARELGLDLAASWMVGDSDADLVAGRRAGCRTVLVAHPATSHRRGNQIPDLTIPDLGSAWDAMQPIMGMRRQLAADA